MRRSGTAERIRRSEFWQPDEYERTWYKQNPPLPVVEWSQRNNNNYEETALLTTISYFAHNTPQWLENYYLKAKRSIEKPEDFGPAAYVISSDGQSREPARGAAAGAGAAACGGEPLI